MHQPECDADDLVTLRLRLLAAARQYIVDPVEQVAPAAIVERRLPRFARLGELADSPESGCGP